jgi:hypothetical protein
VVIAESQSGPEQVRSLVEDANRRLAAHDAVDRTPLEDYLMD